MLQVHVVYSWLGPPHRTMSASHTPPPPERYSLTSEQFAQIKQHYEPTVHPPEVPLQDPEIITNFQRLQLELQSFLHRHISDTVALQDRIVNKATAKVPDSGAHSNQDLGDLSTGVPDLESHGSDDGASIHDTELKSRTTHRVPVPNINIPLQEHISALQAFLTMHSMNLQTLQKAHEIFGQRQETTLKVADHNGSANDTLNLENLNQQFNMQVLESTFTAALIVAVLSLVVSIISDNRSTTFNVGMLFAFISVGIHFGNIVIAGRGIALTAQIDELLPGKDASYFRFYLAACEQLQFVATLVFILSTIIMTFIIFSSVAYPIVLLVLSIVSLVFVFSSVYWEVSMTFRNWKFLAKNIQSLRTSWNTVSNRHRRRVFPNLYRREKPPT
ncbi:hypothetical protein D9619_011333 [Psilocybe cf. subviscida]|uniref:Uncharacterized protein n=1 Tax=Psilocybe cf. subviscida TaxID=2480587 RepID=A0A8H5BLJ3_9AGAR|nr:hypothetical protein D9619_011333 [Psilocybe cf. subviscida]